MVGAVATGGTVLAAEDSPPSAEPRRFAVLVGSNASPPGRKELRYAHRDVQAVVDVLQDVGAFEREDVVSLQDPEPDELLDALDRQLDRAARSGQSLLLFYYSGHADAHALYPVGKALPLRALKTRLERDSVHVRIGVIDACRGGGWTGTKGLREAEVFEVNIPLVLANQGSALVASSSGLEDAHESEVLQGSFFTHYWLAALRGAGDENEDGQVTFGEAFEYAKYFTVRDTAVQTPTPRAVFISPGVSHAVSEEELETAGRDASRAKSWSLRPVSASVVPDGYGDYSYAFGVAHRSARKGLQVSGDRDSDAVFMVHWIAGQDDWHWSVAAPSLAFRGGEQGVFEWIP